MGVIDWVGSKVAKYGLGLKGVTSKDVKILRKYFPVSEMYKLKNMSEKDAYKIYHKAKADDLARLVEIIQTNKKKIMKHFKNTKIELSSKDLNNIIMALQKIVKGKRAKKSKQDMEALIDGMLETFQKTNPDWFDEDNFVDETILRL